MDLLQAFDRAAINKGGLGAKTNFPLSQYADEIDDLKGETLLWTLTSPAQSAAIVQAMRSTEIRQG